MSNADEMLALEKHEKSLTLRGLVALRQVAAVRELHKPFAIYTECDHDHETTGDGVVQVDEIGLTCEKLYDVCHECCTDWDDQSNKCVETHHHKPGEAYCKTIAALSSAETGQVKP